MKETRRSMGRTVWLAFGLAGLEAFGATGIKTIEPTQMQAKIVVITDQSGSCTYRASEGASFTTLLPDLLDNGTTDARTGSIVHDDTHIFVLGTRRGNDALANATQYWIGVTCGTDAEVSTSFYTLPLQWGNMAPDAVPFNPAKFGNMDYPVIDWTNQQKAYVDPVTGVKFWRVTGPGQLVPGSSVVAFAATSQAPIDLTGSGQWSGVANAAYNTKSTPTAFAIGSGGTADKIFVPLATANSNAGSGWFPATNVDDVLFHLFCGNASQSGITITAQYTLDGGQTLQGTPVTSAACPTGSPAQVGVYPQAAAIPLFQGWGMTPPQHNLVIPPSGNVDVAGTVATLHSPAATGNYFPTEWTAGTPIVINGTVRHVASVQSATQVTLIENAGTLSNVPWSGANSGIVLWKSAGGSVSLSIGIDILLSSPADTGTNGDTGMVNAVPVPVSKSADGATTFNPPLAGYLMASEPIGLQGSILLWVPYNPDGTVRAETRLLSIGVKTATSGSVNLQGDTGAYPFSVTVLSLHSSAFDGVTPNAWFALSQGGDGNYRIFKMSYDETLPGCAGYVAYNPFPASGGYNTSSAVIHDDCFNYQNLTPSSRSMDVNAQFIAGFQTGRNSLGASVGVAHPGFDLGFLGPPALGLTGGGILTVQRGQNEHLAVVAGFDSTSGVLNTIRAGWGIDDPEARWCGLHAIGLLAGSFRWLACNPLNNNTGSPGSTVFNTSFDMPIIKVNRAGFGSAPAWDSNTALAAGESYACPPDSALPARYQLATMQGLGYTGSGLGGSPNCIQIKVSTPPCSASPNTSYTFPDGKHEAQEFPCTTPGFGVADATKSKLMDLTVGDWLWVPAEGFFGEELAVWSIAYNGANDIDLWLLRFARHNYLNPLLLNGDDFGNGRPRPAGWSVSVAPTLNTSSSAFGIDLALGGTAQLLPDNGIRAECHGVVGAGSAPGLYSYMEPCDVPYYRGMVDKTPIDMLFKPFLPTAAAFPGFAGNSNGLFFGNVQQYNNASYNPGASTTPFQMDFRHMNPAFGNGPETLGATICAARSLTAVAGTSKSFLIKDTCSAGASDYKRLPIYGFAGHYLLNDVSSPATGNTADLPDYSMCRAFNANECFQGSAAGNLYVTVPKAYIDGNCHTDTFTLAAPCVFQQAPLAGQIIQFRLDKTNSSGLTTRKFGYNHGMPGLQYQFSNCRATPEAAFAFCAADWLDGVRSEWVAIKIDPMGEPDSQDRTSFIPVTVTVHGTADATSIRARFGYLENGTALLNCTPYQVSCSTEIPSAASNDPFSFVNESVTRQSCASGATCMFSIPALPNRMLYYVIDRLDGSGNIVSSLPMHVVAVP